MKILFVEPGKEAQPAEIQGDLKEMQAIVGGQIQALYPWEDPVALICNDEGKLLRLPLNRALEDYDMIAGNFFICGVEGDLSLIHIFNPTPSFTSRRATA